ncbi:MAG TPA: muconolactone Delta-isomerase family protein [Actinomycetales bacterium]|nr:muconolactone Delta-isomerase family protein [Actinomycetales bacterium]
MEFLVTMTTHVPEGTSQAAVEDVRSREAAHSGELAAQGNLLRLWRPPLQPGEWRTLGLFAAADAAALEKVLASMPLRVWRTDEVTPLSPHPNDPPHTARLGSLSSEAGNREFLTTLTLTVPAGTPSETVDATTAREADRARTLGGEGRLVRLWRLPGEGRALGLWRAHDEADVQEIMASLPLYPWLSVETTPLTRHPSDPVSGAV